MLKRHTCPHCQARFAKPEYPGAKPLDLFHRTPRACPNCGGPLRLKLLGWNTGVFLFGLFLWLVCIGLLGEGRWLRGSAASALFLLALFVPLQYVGVEARPSRESKQNGDPEAGADRHLARRARPHSRERQDPG